MEFVAGSTAAVLMHHSRTAFGYCALASEVTPAIVSTSFITVAPVTGSSTTTTPTFSWTNPVCTLCSIYVYVFQLEQTSNSNNIWEVPGNANGLPYATTSLTWNVDPTDSGNTTSVSSLTLGTSYFWEIYVKDSNGNEAITQADYTP